MNCTKSRIPNTRVNAIDIGSMAPCLSPTLQDKGIEIACTCVSTYTTVTKIAFIMKKKEKNLVSKIDKFAFHRDLLISIICFSGVRYFFMNHVQNSCSLSVIGSHSPKSPSFFLSAE